MTISTNTAGTKVGRARRQLSQLWQVPAFLIGLLAFLGAAVSAPWRHPPQWWEFDTRLAALRAGIEQEAPVDPLAAQADAILLELTRFPDRAAEAQFLSGSAYYRQAREKPAVYARELWPRAAEVLGKVSEAALPEADRLAYKYRLGYSLYQQKRDVLRALELMTLAVDKGAEQPLDGYRLLVKAYLAQEPANVESALAASQRILDLTPEKDAAATAQARLQHGELLLRKQARADAVKELERIGASAPRDIRIKARLLQARASEEDGQWQRAIAIWQDLLNEAAHVEGGRARVLYALGWCYHQMDPPKNDDTVRVWSEALKLGGLDGQAAGLHLGALRLSLGNDHASQALADWKLALAGVNSPKEYNNPHVELADLCKLFDQALARFQEKQDPEKTQLVAELYRKIAPSDVANKKVAKAAEELAEQLLDKHKNQIDNVALDAVHAQFRRAAEAYGLAAAGLSNEERPALLWRSVQCYLSARDVPLALKALTEHVAIEKSETRLAEARFTLGDLYRSQGEKKLAREAFVKCIEIPDTPFASRSRYYLALEEIDKKSYKDAYEILKQNLNDDNPSFDRPAHEKSLYKLAWLVLQMKNYEEAVVYLKECQRLYPENPNVLLAREQLGECYRSLARKESLAERDLFNQIKTELNDERRRTLEENARGHRLTRLRWLATAVRTYQEMADELEKERARQKKLTPQGEVLLRRAGVGMAECQAEGEDFLEAAKVFHQVQTRHRRTLESLYAGIRVADMAELALATQLAKEQQSDILAKAKDSLRMLGEDLQNLPESHEIFRGRDTYPREQWLRWHESATRRLSVPPKKANPLPFIQ